MRPVIVLASLLIAVHTYAATELEPRISGPTPGNVTSTQTAYAAGKYLTVWRQQFYPEVGIWGALSDADGNVLGPAFPIVPLTNATYFRLFAMDDSFLLAWPDASGTTATRIDTNGRIVEQRSTGRIPFDILVDHTLLGVGGTNDAPSVVTYDLDAQASQQFRLPATSSYGLGVIPGNHSFYVVGFYPDLKLWHYSLNGDLLNTTTLVLNDCHTTLDPCWAMSAALPLPSGGLLAIIGSSAFGGPQQMAAVTIAADGTFSPRLPFTTTFPLVQQTMLARIGTAIVAVVTGGASIDAPMKAEATPLSANGEPFGPPVTLIDDLAPAEAILAAQAPDALLLATMPRRANGQVRTFLFRDLHPTVPQIVSNTATIQDNTQIASTGRNFLAAWEDTNGVGWPEVHWRALDANAQPLSNITKAGGAMAPHSLVSNGSDYLMLVSYGGPLAARRIAADGTLLAETTLTNSATWNTLGYASAVATGTSYLAAWISGAAIYIAVITPAGAVSAPQAVVQIGDLPAGHYASFSTPMLGWDGQEALLVVRRSEVIQTGFPPSIPVSDKMLAFRLRGDGTLLSPTPVDIGRTSGSPVLIASSGGEFLIATESSNIVMKSGAVIARRDALFFGVTDAVWDGSTYLVARAMSVIERVGTNGVDLAWAARNPLGGTVDLAVDSSARLVIVGSDHDISSGPLRAFAFTPADYTPWNTALRRRTIAH